MRPKLLHLLLWGALAGAAPAHAYDAEVVSVIGSAEARASGSDAWSAARIKQQLNSGAFVRTGSMSQMALLLRDQTQLRLNQNSMIQIKEVSPAGAPTKLELSVGRVWTQAKPKISNKSAPPAVTVQTPSATAAIRGTDWELVVDKDGTSTLTVLSGEVEFYNDLGRVSVGRNEQARVEPGKAPVKVLLTDAKERVQWVTAYRPQPRRWLPQAPADLQPAVDAIEAGRFGDALALLEARPTDAPAAILLADLYVSLGRVPEAIQLLDRHRDEPRAAALLARAYLVADRAADAARVLAEARARRPEDAELLLAQGDLARFDGDAPRARSAYEQALTREPRNPEAWFGLGRVDAEREAVKPGRSALTQALALNPGGAGYRGELATLESFANDFAASERSFNDALAQQPDDYVALTGLGILQLKRGDPNAALESLLKAGVLEPRYARAALYTGVTYYQLGNQARAIETLRRAAELDPRDPLPHMMLSLIASDRMELGEAVNEARRASELMPYLKSLNQLLNNQKGNANVGASLAQFGLEEWAQAYAYNSYSPYWAGSALFLADRYSGTFNKNSELFKGFLADPTVFGASNRFNTLIASPGNYATVGGRLTEQDVHDRGGSLVANGYSVSSVPFAYFASADLARVLPNRNALRVDGDNYTAGFGVRPTYELSLFLFANEFSADARTNSPQQGLFDATVSLDNRRSDLGANYKFSPTSHLWVKAGAGKEDSSFNGVIFAPAAADALNAQFGSGFSPFGEIKRLATTVEQSDGQLRHTFDTTSQWQVSWGLETGRQKKPAEVRLSFGPVDPGRGANDERYSNEVYVSNRFKVQDNLLLQADVSHIRLTKRQASEERLSIGTLDFTTGTLRDDRDISEWNPRIGFAWNPAAGQTLRLAYQQWRRPVSANTLAPVDTAGVAFDDRLVALGGELQRTRVQYEWEMAGSTFAQGYLDRKRVRNLTNAGGTLVGDITLEDLERLRSRNRLSPQAIDLLESTSEFGEADVHAAGFAVNRLLTQNLSGSLRYAYNHSRNTGDGFQGNLVPWLPRHLFNIGANWLPAARWQLGLSSTYRSKRYRDEANTQLLGGGWNLGLRSYWESADKRLSVEVIAENLHSDKQSAAARSAVLGTQVLYRF